MTSRPLTRIIALALMLGALGLARLCVGFSLGWPTDPLYLELRLVSVFSAISVGVCLSVSGVMFSRCCAIRLPAHTFWAWRPVRH